MNAPTPISDIPRTQLFDMLKRRGWIGSIDYILILATIVWPIVGLKALGWPLMLVMVFNVVIILFWLLLVVYRIAYFVLMIQVAMDSMPATSARLAVKFLKTVPSNLPTGA